MEQIWFPMGNWNGYLEGKCGIVDQKEEQWKGEHKWNDPLLGLLEQKIHRSLRGSFHSD